MHLWRIWIAVGSFAAVTAGAAVIYKWTDPDGVVHYSDQAVPGAEKIIIASGSSNGIGGAVRTTGPLPNKPPVAAAHVLALVSPAPEEVFFGDQPVMVRLRMEPPPTPDQAITWHLNGQPLDAQANSSAFTLPTLPRGAYVIGATVSDLTSGQSQDTDPVTFYVRQPSELSPQHQKP